MIILTVSYFVLWILVIMLAFITISLLRRMQPGKRQLRLQDRGLEVGTVFPKLKLYTFGKKFLHLDGVNKSGTVIFVGSATCSACNTLYPLLTPFQKQHTEISVVAMILGDEETLNKKIEINNIAIPVVQLDDHDLPLYGIAVFPFAYFLSNTGKVLAKGGIASMQDFDLLLETAKSAS